MHILLNGLGIGLLGCTGVTDDTSTPPSGRGPVVRAAQNHSEILRELPTDFEILSEDYESFEELDYVVQTWSLSPDAPDHYESLTSEHLDTASQPMDVLPSFYVLRGTATQFRPERALIWMHGGTVANDEDYPETGVLPESCQVEKVHLLAASPITNLQMQIVAAVEDGWTILFPRNDWCDGWLGLGPEDPYRTWHHGNYHLNRMLNFAETGALGFEWPSHVSLWGTSAGGNGALFWSARRQGFASVAIDSSPNNWIAYYRFDPDVVLAHFGGPPFDDDETPSEFYSEYADASGWTLLESGKLDLPLFIGWNSQDALVADTHAESMIEILEANPTLLNGRWSHTDFNRKYPAGQWHVQTTDSELPPAYAGYSILRFLTGNHVTWMGAEAGCNPVEACTVGEVIESDETTNPAWRMFSNSAALYAPNTEPGVLWSQKLTDQFPANQAVFASFAVSLNRLESLEDDDVVGRIIVREPSGVQTQNIFAKDIHVNAGPKEVPLSERLLGLHQIQATTMEFTITDPDEASIEWVHMGATDTFLDQVIFSTAWE